MRRLLRLSVAVLSVAVLSFGGWIAARSAGLAVPDLGLNDLRRLVAEEERRDALAERAAALAEGNKARHEVVLELLDERLTLRQAVEEFRLLSATGGVSPELLMYSTGGATYDEALARSVLSWAKAELCERPADPRSAVLCRLQAEYAASFRHPYSPAEEHAAPITE
jgi:hypothetical protein